MGKVDASIAPVLTEDVKRLLLSIGTLDEIKEAWDILKRRHRQLQENMVVNFSIGDSVKFTGRRGVTVTGKITKLNNKSIEVLEDSKNGFGLRWKVAPSLLSKI